MTSRVSFVPPAMNTSLRLARFDDGCSLDAGGEARARAAAGSLRPAVRVLVSPSARCRETAAALGLDAVGEERLAGLDMGRWRGLTLDEVGAAEPQEVGRWLADPDAAPHGGESVTDLCARVGRWLDTARETEGHTIAVVEPEIVRAVVVRVLGAPTAAFWRLDVPPLSVTSVSGRDGRWNLRLGQPLDPAAA
ncbi:histidine phosphatase family protein [Streptomyces sp. NBC_00582]|uniref:histidine phosphatase family protein n=1 Tax=Streptomyces sp. NBC_00582 TaxID=2975783 RepID=UPI002E8098F0|nr:histidine phosphatase family protein [Streptomyces sp. NBC_00582]WUB61340.1 histidine phosphatase family protein [Streptomyces sp. NBC_00582]